MFERKCEQFGQWNEGDLTKLRVVCKRVPMSQEMYRGMSEYLIQNKVLFFPDIDGKPVEMYPKRAPWNELDVLRRYANDKPTESAEVILYKAGHWSIGDQGRMIWAKGTVAKSYPSLRAAIEDIWEVQLS